MPGSPPTRRWIIIPPFGATVVFETSATLTDATSKAGGWAAGWPNAMHEMKAIRLAPIVVLVIYFSFASPCDCFPHLAWGRPRKRRLSQADRKSTRLNSSHLGISYAVFCLKK